MDLVARLEIQGSTLRHFALKSFYIAPILASCKQKVTSKTIQCDWSVSIGGKKKKKNLYMSINLSSGKMNAVTNVGGKRLHTHFSFSSSS